MSGSLSASVESAGSRSDPVAVSRARIDTLRAISRPIFRLTNRVREERGLTPLTRETTLRRIACQHTRDMLAREFIQHKNPDGDGPEDRVAQGHRRLIGEVGENLWGQSGAWNGNPEALAERIVEQWMDSPPHRTNLLRPGFSHLGVCTLRQGDRIRGTQVFARVRAYLRSPLPRTAPAGSTVAATIEKTFPDDAQIAKYDFWDPETGASITAPLIFAGTLQLPETTGPVRPRFYVPKSNRYRIHWGPEISVTPAER